MKIISQAKNQGHVLIAGVLMFVPSVSDLAGFQTRFQDQPGPVGFGRGTAAISGQVLPAAGSNHLPPAVWVHIRGVSGYAERQIVEADGSFHFAQVPHARLVLTVEADGHEPATFELNPGEGDTNVQVAVGRRLVAEPGRLTNAPYTIDARSLKVPGKAVRELEAAGRHIRQGRWDKASDHLQKAIHLHPAFHEAYNDLGVVNLRMGRYQDAKAAFSKAVEISPNSEAGQANLGLFYLVMERWELAIEHLSRAVAINPSKPNTQTFLGEALCGLGRCTEAETILKRVVTLNPEFWLAYSKLGYVYLKLQHYSEALDMFRRFMKSPQGKDNPEVAAIVAKLQERKFFHRRDAERGEKE